MSADGFTYNDGGRAAAGFKGSANDCVCRAIAIVSGIPYLEVYKRLASGAGSQRDTRRTGKQRASARNGIYTRRQWFRDYMAEIGFRWVPTMQIGSGCKVHLCADELPGGRIVVAVSRHYTAMIDGIIHDTFDPRREVHCIRPDDGGKLKAGEWRNDNGICSVARRCVYGYWTMEPAQ